MRKTTRVHFSPLRWQYRGIVGEIESADTDASRFQCVESAVEAKRPVDAIKAYPSIVIGRLQFGVFAEESRLSG